MNNKEFTENINKIRANLDKLETWARPTFTSNEKLFLQSVQEYIEKWEVAGDGEWGRGGSLDELIREGQMPGLYAEVLKRLEKMK